jgi:hypothetical protein
MRTTVVLDDAIMEEIASTAQKEHTSMKDILNRTLARGLGYCAERPAPWICATHELGLARIAIDKAWNTVDRLEEEAVIGKLDLKK